MLPMRTIFFLLLMIIAGLAGCDNSAGSTAPSTKAVDSATAAAPDTIKAISLDSLKR
jgi:hypothetical protein